MKFDKSRVYTAVNADELKIGSKCIFADTVKALRKKVQADDYAQYVQPFIRLHDEALCLPMTEARAENWWRRKQNEVGF